MRAAEAAAPMLMSAAGNAFALFDGLGDGLGDGLPDDPARRARELCLGPPPPPGLAPLQGILLVRAPRAGGAARMEIYNADGSRSEMCGNGLRCVAKHLCDTGRVLGDELVVETDVGPRAVSVLRRAGAVCAARAEMGVPAIVEPRGLLEHAGEPVEYTLVDTGNPHCVIFVADERAVPFERLGAALERHPRFPAGVNVHFAAPRRRVLALRSWERGVGPTPSCGTGSCAAAAAGVYLGISVSPVWVECPGGTLEVEWGPGGEVSLTGPVRAGLPPAAPAPAPLARLIPRTTGAPRWRSA